MTTLKKGDKGNDVKELQKLLHISPDGIFGNVTEIYVKAFQKEHGLEDDGIVGPLTWAALGIKEEMQITKSYLSNHITAVSNKQNKYIVIHYTAGSSSKPGSAMGVKKVFEKRQASSDFAIDDSTILQLNPDLNKYGTWHCGDKKNPYSNGGKYYGKCTNRNSIGIEVCSNLMKGTTSSAANHDGWYYSKESIDNLVKLVKYLMKKFNIDKDHVIRHYDVSGKICPGVPGWNNEPMYDPVTGKKNGKNNNDSEWHKFLNRL